MYAADKTNRRCRPAALALAAALLMGALALSALVPEASGADEANAPNLLVISTDDQSLNQWSEAIMPLTFARLAQGGTAATQAIAVPPLCCPARASLLTGSYPHNHGVLQNFYKLLKGKENTLPVWLREAGYRTAFIGKYLNGYQNFNDGIESAPGFDHWWGIVGKANRYYDYTISVDGETHEFGSDREDYLTTRINEHSVEFIEDAAARDEPFFLWVSHVAPHGGEHPPDSPCRGGPVALPEDLDVVPPGETLPLRERPVPRAPSYDEAQVKDKPRFIRQLPRIDAEMEARIDRRVRCRWAALQEVDRGVEAIFEALADTGQLERTAIVLFSDNGTLAGEHRIPGQKALPYEPALRIPFALWVPEGILGAPPVASLDGLVGTIDIAPTLLELAGAAPCNESGKCRRMDGISLLGALRGEPSLKGRELLIQIGLGCSRFRTVRSQRYQYTEWIKKRRKGCKVVERELYDLKADPAMLKNRLRQGRRPRKRLVRRLQLSAAKLSRCSGIKGRERLGVRPFCG